jgi:diacylglycerol kinase (ATP)
MSNQEFINHKSWKAAFKNAFEGCFYAFTTQRNFIIHLILSLLAIILAWWLKISFERFLFLIFAIVFGLTIEMVNTAFEKTIDLITEEFNLKAKIAKDLAAGMMLLVSLGLAIIGFLILFPPLWTKLVG